MHTGQTVPSVEIIDFCRTTGPNHAAFTTICYPSRRWEKTNKKVTTLQTFHSQNVGVSYFGLHLLKASAKCQLLYVGLCMELYKTEQYCVCHFFLRTDLTPVWIGIGVGAPLLMITGIVATAAIVIQCMKRWVETFHSTRCHQIKQPLFLQIYLLLDVQQWLNASNPAAAKHLPFTHVWTLQKTDSNSKHHQNRTSRRRKCRLWSSGLASLHNYQHSCKQYSSWFWWVWGTSCKST